MNATHYWMFTASASASPLSLARSPARFCSPFSFFVSHWVRVLLQFLRCERQTKAEATAIIINSSKYAYKSVPHLWRNENYVRASKHFISGCLVSVSMFKVSSTLILLWANLKLMPCHWIRGKFCTPKHTHAHVIQTEPKRTQPNKCMWKQATFFFFICHLKIIHWILTTD